MLTHLSVILTNLAITLILVGFVWYYFKNKVENLENILNYQSQILKNAIQNNSIPNNGFVSSNDFLTSQQNNKIDIIEENDDSGESSESDDEDDEYDDDDEETDREGESDRESVQDEHEDDDKDDDEVNNTEDDDLNNSINMIESDTKEIKVINIELNQEEVNEDEFNLENANLTQLVTDLELVDKEENNETLLENVETEINNQESYNKLNVKQLKEIAVNKGLGDAKEIKNMKKQELISLVVNNKN